MDSMRIEILNKDVLGILKQLAKLNLIKLKSDNPSTEFITIIEKLRSTSSEISMNEITKEIEAVRSKRHANKP